MTVYLVLRLLERQKDRCYDFNSVFWFLKHCVSGIKGGKGNPVLTFAGEVSENWLD